MHMPHYYQPAYGAGSGPWPYRPPGEQVSSARDRPRQRFDHMFHRQRVGVGSKRARVGSSVAHVSLVFPPQPPNPAAFMHANAPLLQQQWPQQVQMLYESITDRLCSISFTAVTNLALLLKAITSHTSFGSLHASPSPTPSYPQPYYSPHYAGPPPQGFGFEPPRGPSPQAYAGGMPDAAFAAGHYARGGGGSHSYPRTPVRISPLPLLSSSFTPVGFAVIIIFPLVVLTLLSPALIHSPCPFFYACRKDKPAHRRSTAGILT